MFLDGHNDLAILIRILFRNKIYDADFKVPFENGGLPLHVDLPRLKSGQVGGTFWSAFIECPADAMNFSSSNYAESELDLDIFILILNDNKVN